VHNQERLKKATASLAFILFLLFLLPAFAQDTAVTGSVFFDANGNGLFDVAEKSVKGAELALISISGASESLISHVTSNQDGQYRFTSVPPGDVYLQVSLPDDLLFTTYTESGSAALPSSGSKGRTPVFPIKPGEEIQRLIGAARQGAYINVTAFGDDNLNGGRFSSEPLLKGVEIALVFELDGQQYTVAEAKTDKDGFAQLRDLTPSEYRLWARMPEPYIIGPIGQKINPFYNIIPPTDSNEGFSEPFSLQRSLGVGIGGVMAGSLSGRIWMDANMDGVMDENEGGYPGVTITLSPLVMGVERSLVTAQEDEFNFNHLQPGMYRLSALLPEGVMFALENSPSIFHDGFTDSQNTQIQVEEGLETILDPIGVMSSSSISVIAFHDVNTNGLPDEGEPAFIGATAEVLTDGEVSALAMSDSEGKALLQRVRGGNVSLRMSLPDSQVFSVYGGENGNVFSSLSAASQVTIEKQLGNGEQLTLFAGVTIPSAITGTLFDDADLSGAYEQGETKLAGFTVQAVNSDGVAASEALTDENGQYLLEDLVPTDYTVRILLVSPFVFSPASSSSASIKNQIISQTPDYGITDVLTLKPGQILEHVDAGAFRSAVITGAVLLGDESDGFTGTQGGLSGIRIELVEESGVPVSVYTIAATDSQGAFSLKGALPGSYRLRFTLTDGVKLSKPYMDDPVFQTEVFNVRTSDILALEPIFAVKTGTLSGLAFFDRDSDGIFSNGDTGLKGANIRIKNQLSGETYELVSGDDGRYIIGGIRPGTYETTVYLPAGFILSNSENSLAPASLTGISTAMLEFLMGTAIDSTTLAAVVPLSISGVGYYDHDLNKKYDSQADTPYPAQFTLTHQGTGSVFSLSADLQGAFSQSPVYPGKYELKISLPEDHLLTAPESATQDGALWTSDIALDQTNTSIELAVVQLSGLFGTVWNMDGSLDGIEGLSITLNDTNGNPLQETSTDANGHFEFTRLMPVDYTLSTALQPGYRFARAVDTAGRPSVITANLADAGGNSGKSGIFRLSMGEQRQNQDIGIGAMGKLGDFAWLDSDGDGMQDAGEPGIPGIEIVLYQYGQIAAQTSTDAYGRYLIADLYPGTYSIQVTMPDELRPTKQQSVFPLVASILRSGEGLTAYSENILVPSGRRNLNCDLGFILRREGVLPPSLLELPQKDWTQVNQQQPKR